MDAMVNNLLRSAVLECCSPEHVKIITTDIAFDNAIKSSLDDLMAFSQKDPAARFNPNIVAIHYSSYRAILHYRLSHELYIRSIETNTPELEDCARLISSRGKLLSGAEIHHHCNIGKRFILDHGVGTVIGETCSLGDDCYVLGGVTMGSSSIADNPTGKRHPTIGDRVQIGAFARILGNITIGDDVFIAPHCVIKNDLLPGSVVTIQSQTQIVKRTKDAHTAHSAKVA